MRVHFICRGNALRSVIAEAYLKSLCIPNLDVCSSGTVAEQYRQQNLPTLNITIKLLAAHGIGDDAKTSADQLSQRRLHDEDMTIFMNQIVYDEAGSQYKLPPNVVVWNIIDAGEGTRLIKPGDDPYQYNEAIYKDIQASVDQLVNELVY